MFINHTDEGSLWCYDQCCGSGSFAWIRIQQKMKEQINKYYVFNFRPVNTGLCVVYCRTVQYYEIENGRYR